MTDFLSHMEALYCCAKPVCHLVLLSFKLKREWEEPGESCHQQLWRAGSPFLGKV
jgi:hypothetical protein